MDRSTDFLILYDLAPIKLRPQLLDTYFEDPACRQSFEHIVHDRVLRAQFEFEYNGAVPFEDFRLLEAQGYLRHECEFRSHVQSDHGREFPSVVTTDKGRNIAITLPDGLDPHVFFPPFVLSYLCRHFGRGIVAKREVFEIALDIEDDDFLALIVDPVFGNPVFPEFADTYQLDTHRYLRDLHTGGNAARWPNHGEIEVKRRERVDWWSTDDRGFIIHDLTIPHVGIEQILRGLPRDQAALRCFAQGDRIPDDRQCAK